MTSRRLISSAAPDNPPSVGHVRRPRSAGAAYHGRAGVRLPAIGWLALLLLPSVALRAAETNLLEALDHGVATLYASAHEAVVKIHSLQDAPFAPLATVPYHRVGTGFFTEADGTLLTVAAVVAGTNRCWIDWQGRHLPLRLVGLDQRLNLAVLKVQPAADPSQPNHFPSLAFGNSDAARIGSMVVAIGFPYDLPSAPVLGLVHGIEIARGNHVFPTSHLRVAARLSPGMAGGPLLDPHGQVVGIAVAAHLDDQCYAVPANAARRSLADILAHGAPQRAMVGLEVTEHRSTAAGDGTARVFVRQVLSNTPAAAAGFQSHDLLLAIGTNQVQHLADVLDTVFRATSGQCLPFTIVRAGNTQAVTVVTAPAPPQSGFSLQFAGASATNAVPTRPSLILSPVATGQPR